MQNNLSDHDRETYYRSRILGFSGEKKQAINLLKTIKENSPYYNRSKNLINDWLN